MEMKYCEICRQCTLVWDVRTIQACLCQNPAWVELKVLWWRSQASQLQRRLASAVLDDWTGLFPGVAVCSPCVSLGMYICLFVCKMCNNTTLWEVGFYMGTFIDDSFRAAHTCFCAAQSPGVGQATASPWGYFSHRALFSQNEVVVL